MEFECRHPHVFICHYGFERSRAAAAALSENSFDAMHIQGGTNLIQTLQPEQVRAMIPKDAKVTVIYDHGSPRQEYEDFQSATAVMDEARIRWRQLSTTDLYCSFYTIGVRLDDYL